MRTLLALAVFCLVVLAGCTAPMAVESGTAQFADPDLDVRGWERGYWYDEPVDVTRDDGLNGSERAAVVSRSMARVERVRAVEFERSVEVDVVTRAELADGPAVGGSGDTPASARIHRNARFEALFLVGERTDSGDTREQNNRQAIQGYYSATEDRVVIVSPTESPRIPEGTLAQELFHAYQYRHLIPNRISRPVTYDRTKAIVSLIEGDANLVERRYRNRCRTNWTCLNGTAPNGSDAGGSGRGGNSGIHMGLYLLQYFPYAEGEQYVRRVQAEQGWDGVDRLYRNLPTSTAEVIHGEERDGASIDLPARGGEDWSVVQRRDSVVDYQTLGEAGLASMFAYTLYDDRRNRTLVDRSAFLNVENGSVDESDPLDYGLAPTAGWRGDRLRVYRKGDRTGYVWRIRFADPAAASRFLDTYRSLLSYHEGQRTGGGYWRIDEGPFADTFYVDHDGDSVTIVNAPSTEAVDAIYSPSE